MKPIPERWRDYRPYGTLIKGTKLLACKVPLKMSLIENLSPDAQFSPQILMAAFPKLKYIIDLTATDRYYNKMDFLSANVGYKKVFVPGVKVPKWSIVLEFYRVMDDFMAGIKDDEIIAIHCTHGLNRTGYLVCRYLVQKMGWNLCDAVREFEAARGHKIERIEYLMDLERIPKAHDLINYSLSDLRGKMPPQYHRPINRRRGSQSSEHRHDLPRGNFSSRRIENWRDHPPPPIHPPRPVYKSKSSIFFRNNYRFSRQTPNVEGNQQTLVTSSRGSKRSLDDDQDFTDNHPDTHSNRKYSIPSAQSLKRREFKRFKN